MCFLFCELANTEGDKKGDKPPTDDKVKQCGDEDGMMMMMMMRDNKNNAIQYSNGVDVKM